MTRKILFIIVGALLFLALLGVLWFWLLHRAPIDTANAPSGFGTSTNKNTTGTAGAQDPSNTASTIPGDITNSTNTGMDGINTSGSAINTGPQGSSQPSNSDSQVGTASSVAGGTRSAAWLQNGASVSERSFSATEINQINSTGGVSGTPLISTTPQSAGLGTSGFVLGLTAAGCVAQFAASNLTGGLTAAADPSTAAVGVSVFVIDIKGAAQRGQNQNQTVWQCIVKSIAQAAVDQITRSVVSWINSGFNGKPSFVTNFNQYFANVADQAAGEFIKGSALSFLCSQFAPQIKIAIAQSYANRNSGASCSLSKVTNNINGFLGGKWGAGGWGGLLQLTTMPTNNPYGAYAYAEVGLQSSISGAQANAKNNVSPGGFISLQKCETPPGPPGPDGKPLKPVCKVTTPGAVIEDSLKTSLAAPIQGLNLAQDINQIITALTNQVMVKALYGGLGSSLGVTNPLSPAIDQGASTQAQGLLAQLQNYLGYATQYASVQQGSISDIQNAQANLNTAFNCWTTAATLNAGGNSGQSSQKAAEADAAQAALGARVDSYNSEITRANASIGAIQNLQSQVLFATTPGEVSSAGAAIQSAVAQGTVFSASAITTAQQNRATLQADLAARNQQTAASLAQCKALGA